MAAQNPNALLTTAEVAKRLRVSADTVLRLVKEETLSASLVGSQYRFRAGDVESMLAGGRRKAYAGLAVGMTIDAPTRREEKTR